jgi:carboxypeptidase family protein/TonB-dependent receptor-like protein
MRPFRLTILILALMALAAPAAAQRGVGTIEGSVLDASDAVMPGVTITVRNRATGLERVTTTDESGRFVIDGLPIEGEYEIRAERAGFEALVRGNVALLLDQAVTIDFVLRFAARERIVVGGLIESALDREHSTLRQAVSEEFVRSLPLLGRGFLPLASLAAGFTGNPDFPDSQGQRYWTNNVIVDGASHFSKWRSAPRSFYSGYGLESVKQVEVLTNLFSAEFGETLASVTSVVTKAGTNERHGSVSLFVRDDALDAVPAFSATTPPSGAAQYGVSLGGPFVKNRTHYFGSFEGRRSRDRNIVISPAAPNAEVPDNQDEQLLFFRIDHQRSPRDLMTARYNGQRFRWHLEGGGLSLPGSGTQYTTNVHTFLFSDGLQLSGRALNEVRAQFARFEDMRTDLRPTAYVSRAGYSIEGGAFGPTGFGADPEDTWEGADTVSLRAGPHALRFGGGLKYVRAHNTSSTYGRGAYFFAGPPNLFPQPYLFTESVAVSEQARVADPRSVSTFAFVQDDWRIAAGLTLNLGVRYDVETVFHLDDSIPVDANNVQPRIGAAWVLGKKARTVLRGGVGLFTQQHLLYPLSRLQLEGPDGAVTISLTPGSPLMPVFPAVLPAFLPDALVPPRDVHRVDAALDNPSAIQASAGAQRAIFGVIVSADVVILNGHDLLSMVDVNAPASVTKPAQRTVEQADATRPLVPAPATYRKIITLGNEGRSWYRALQIKFDRAVGPVHAMGSYTLARAEDMANYALPEDSRNLPAERARADTDVRHNVASSFTWQLPGAGPLAGGWSVAGIGVFRSNRPYTISWGDDRNGTTQSDARPGGRNTGKTGPYRSVDLALSKRFARGRSVTEARVEAFNLFNAVNHDQYIGALLSPLYAQPVSAFPPRRIQLAAVVRF